MPSQPPPSPQRARQYPDYEHLPETGVAILLCRSRKYQVVERGPLGRLVANEPSAQTVSLFSRFQMDELDDVILLEQYRDLFERLSENYLRFPWTQTLTRGRRRAVYYPQRLPRIFVTANEGVSVGTFSPDNIWDMLTQGWSNLDLF